MAYPAPVWCIGTYDADDKPNVMTASWAGICCSKPPCVAVSLRKATYTFGSLGARKAFTVSIPSDDHAREADYFGKASGRDVDKFAASGLTPIRAEHVDAPFVEEFPIVLECRLIHDLEIGLHTLFVGEILDVKADDAILDDKGLPVMERMRPFVFAPELRGYYAVGENIGRAFALGKEI
jgi:flavin reductase (DIM6/NTAB) family NADH-FMN oxidoreductase RutF